MLGTTNDDNETTTGHFIFVNTFVQINGMITLIQVIVWHRYWHKRMTILGFFGINVEYMVCNKVI